MATTLRARIIRLAATAANPDLRRLLLAVLDDSMDTSPTGWATTLRMLRMKPELDAEAEAAENYQRQIILLRTLQKGDAVEITYNDSQRGGEVRTRREVLMSWDDLKGLDGVPANSFHRPQVTLKAKAAGRFKEGRIIDYGRDRGVFWQGTMLMHVQPVLNLRKV